MKGDILSLAKMLEFGSPSFHFSLSLENASSTHRGETLFGFSYGGQSVSKLLPRKRREAEEK